ncbi:transporter [Kocuria flava]|uniref:RDD family protein n=1 Tax=Kocuria flava TaxID=446860 RepID=A0A0U2WU26_9MICC|nr:RDD family protein [Kocuria flava]ALU39876.1 transporter [Kocuria flava]GEO93389.1 RDD family protein [Kocuria flava]
MIDRRDLGSWLEGPRTRGGHPGERLGRPAQGPGSVGRPGRRLVALVVDWYLCWALAQWLLPGWNDHGLVTVGVLLVLNVLAVGATGHTPGHLLTGLQVQTLEGRPAGFARAVVRAVLLCLVIPAVVFDADQRGLHDRAAGTLLVRVR